MPIKPTLTGIRNLRSTRVLRVYEDQLCALPGCGLKFPITRKRHGQKYCSQECTSQAAKDRGQQRLREYMGR